MKLRPLAAMLSVLGVLCSSALAADERPNIVLITADDLGMHLGCFGFEGIKTPHLDQFASEGMRFSRAYVTQSSCSPSRSSMLTGLYPHQNGQVGLAPFSKYGYRMREDVLTLPRLLKDAGYRTAILGKIHVEPQTGALFPSETRTPPAAETMDVERVAREAGEFIEDSDAPFFLMVNYFDPHRIEGGAFADQFMGYPKNPLKPDEVEPFDFMGGVDFPALRKQIAGYLNGTMRLDDGIGLLMAKLDEVGVTDNTLVIFLSDNGPPFTLGKCSLTEAGVQTPMLVRWPGRVPAGRNTDFFTSAIDLMPTILAVTGVEGPSDLPGLNLKPLLESGEPGKLHREFLFTEFTAHAAPHFFPKRAVRNDRYKLIWNMQFERRNPLTALTDKATAFALQQPEESTVHQIFSRWLNPPEYELYDLEKDPHEIRNLAGQAEYSGIEGELKTTLMAWRTETEDPIGPDTPNPSEKL